MDLSARAAASTALALAAALSACSADRAPVADTTVSVDDAASIGGAGGAVKVACPGTGHWSACAVLKRLEAAGVAPQKAASLPDLPPLAGTPLLYTVGRSGLAIYLFADSAARSRAALALDTARYVAAAKALTMRGETTAIQNDNLLALLYSRSEQQRERVSDAFTAGPPQPAKP